MRGIRRIQRSAGLRSMKVGIRRVRLPGVTAAAWVGGALLLGSYFSYAALQGDSGIFRRIQIIDQATELQKELDRLNTEIGKMRNLTLRLSDDYLDLDLLDERARKVLGYIRTDEIIIN